MIIYIASSWKNQHAVEMLTERLRDAGHVVRSFVENNQQEDHRPAAKFDIDTWAWTKAGEKCFAFDTRGATESDLVIYIGPSGNDAWAEVGAAWAKGVKILGLWAKGEQSGLMRRMVIWCDSFRQLLKTIEAIERLTN